MYDTGVIKSTGTQGWVYVGRTNNFSMEQIKSDVESFARIRVVGAGGSGGNAVN